jgi:uncharacterized protein (DUF433 family)
MTAQRPLKQYKNYEWLVKDPEYVNGRIAIKGTRLPAYLIMQCLAEGMSYEEIQETYMVFPKEALAEVLSVAAEAIQDADVAA